MTDRDQRTPTPVASDPRIGTHKDEEVVWFCTDCDDFELGKRYTGRSGTDAEREYEAIEPPSECPACGGEVKEETVSE